MERRDYLSALPVEIWRYIFQQLRTLYPEFDPSTDPITIIANPGIIRSDLLPPQAFLASLSTVCKSLRPIVDEVLYSHIYLFAGREYDDFTEIINKPHIGGIGARGQLTRQLYLKLIPQYGSYKISPDMIPTIFPNLISLRLSTSNQSEMEEWEENLGNWASTMRHLNCDISKLSPGFLHFISLRFTELTTLTLDSFRAPRLSQDKIIFPKLQQLSIVCQYLRGPEGSEMTFPSLRWLSIRFKELKACVHVNHISTFIHRHQANLIGLEIRARPGMPAHIGFTLEGFVVGNLKTLILPSSVVPTSASTLTHQIRNAVETVVLRLSTSSHTYTPELVPKLLLLRSLQMKRFIMIESSSSSLLVERNLDFEDILPGVVVEHRYIPPGGY